MKIEDENTRTIRTDHSNSRFETAKLADFTLILPPDSMISIGDKIRVNPIGTNRATTEKDLERILLEAVEECGKSDAVLVSGGIDSSVIAAIATKLDKDCDLIVAGFEGSEDVTYARLLGEKLGKRVSCVILDDGAVERIAKELKALDLDTYNIILGIVEFAALEYARSRGYHAVLSGLGSDELFFGFKKHRELEVSRLAGYREERLFYLAPTDLLRVHKLSGFFGIKIFTPYLSDSVVEHALGLNTDVIVDSLYDKGPIRRAGKELGLSGPLLERKKKAMQYGSGLMNSLERLSKKRGIKNVGEFLKSI